jgi:hypothetical protein
MESIDRVNFPCVYNKYTLLAYSFHISRALLIDYYTCIIVPFGHEDFLFYDLCELIAYLDGMILVDVSMPTSLPHVL